MCAFPGAAKVAEGLFSFLYSDAVTVIEYLNFYWVAQLIVSDSDMDLICVCVQSIPDEFGERVDWFSASE